MSNDRKLCPHGVDLRMAHCCQCADPAFHAAQQPPVVNLIASTGTTRQPTSNLCNCQTVSDDYSDHMQSCPVWLTGCANRLDRENYRLRTALLDLYNGTAEYVYLNNLGDPHNTTPMQKAAEALGVAYPRSLGAKNLLHRPSDETPEQYQCRKCGSSDVMPWPTAAAKASDALRTDDDPFKPTPANGSEPL